MLTDRRWITVITALVLSVTVLFVFAACGDNEEPEHPTNGREDNGDPGDGNGHVDAEITLIANDDFTFDPSHVTVTTGERVRLILDNSDALLLHDLTIENMVAEDIHSEGAEHEGDDHGAEEALHVATGPGETGVLEFTPIEPGEYVFYCTVEGHREAGMEGTLAVQ